MGSSWSCNYDYTRVWYLIPHSSETAILTLLVVLLEVISQRYQSIIRSEVYHPYSISRPLLSEHPTFGSGTADTYYSRGSTKGNVSSENGSAITIHEHEPVASTEFQALSDSTRYPRSAPIKVDHLKFLIKMAQTECELLNESVHLASVLRGLRGSPADDNQYRKILFHILKITFSRESFP